MDNVSTTKGKQGKQQTAFVFSADASSTSSIRRSAYQAAPALELDKRDELRMALSNQQLILETVTTNHGGIDDMTLQRYKNHLEHFDVYITSVLGVSIYDAKRKHILQFMNHLERHGGPKPHESRLRCEWCKQRGYPDGKGGKGWSASYRKSYLSAIRFLYQHFHYEEDLPEINPAAHVPCPKVVVRKGYTPTEDEVQLLLDAGGSPKSRLIAHWVSYAPSRRATFANALWRDVDLDAGEWEVVGKGKKVERFYLHPTLIREFRAYRRWQQREADGNSQMRNALSDEDTAYVLLTRNGKKIHDASIGKILKWRSVRAGVGVITAKGKWDAPGGKTSKLSPHALRRAWATAALNNGIGIDVVQEGLGHADLSTTRRHYANTKSERVRDAMVNMRYTNNKRGNGRDHR